MKSIEQNKNTSTQPVNKCLSTFNAVPSSVAEVVGVRWLVEGEDWPLAVVHADLDGSVNQLEDEVVSAPVHGHQDARVVARADLQLDVDVTANSERFLCHQRLVTCSQKSKFVPKKLKSLATFFEVKGTRSLVIHQI